MARRWGARSRGFLAGYREVIKGVELEIFHPNPRWMKGFEEGKEAARADLKERAAGPFELPYVPLAEHKAALAKAREETP